MPDTVLSIRELSKNYGRIKAVDKLSMDVERGNIFGILGPNGSGKTTTLGIVLSVINASSGSFSWFGKEPDKSDRKRIGAILEVPIFYPYISGENNLKIIADIKGCGHDGIPDVLRTVDLTARRKSKFRTYSLGMKQRLAIAAALLGEPEVLILDEPTNGLDPQGIAEIRELILRIARGGITIILASHLLDEVQKICSHVVVLDKGRNIFTGDVAEMVNASSVVELGAEDMSLLRKYLEENENVSDILEENTLLLVSLKEGYTTTMLSRYFITRDLALTHLTTRKKSLEKYFLELLAQK